MVVCLKARITYKLQVIRCEIHWVLEHEIGFAITQIEVYTVYMNSSSFLIDLFKIICCTLQTMASQPARRQIYDMLPRVYCSLSEKGAIAG